MNKHSHSQQVVQITSRRSNVREETRERHTVIFFKNSFSATFRFHPMTLIAGRHNDFATKGGEKRKLVSAYATCHAVTPTIQPYVGCMTASMLLVSTFFCSTQCLLRPFVFPTTTRIHLGQLPDDEGRRFRYRCGYQFPDEDLQEFDSIVWAPV